MKFLQPHQQLNRSKQKNILFLFCNIIGIRLSYDWDRKTEKKQFHLNYKLSFESKFHIAPEEKQKENFFQLNVQIAAAPI